MGKGLTERAEGATRPVRAALVSLAFLGSALLVSAFAQLAWGTEGEFPSVPAVSPAGASAEGTAPRDVVAAVTNAGCGGCHTIPGIPGAEGTVGPDLTRIGAEAGERKPGTSVADYIRESILDPNAFIAPECPSGDCPPGVMLQTFRETLSPEQLDTIVGYLSSLGTADAAPLEAGPSEGPLSAERPPEAVSDPVLRAGGDPPSDEQIALGKYLFFDERLSASNALSCASCHQPEKAFTDGRRLSDGFPGTKLFRNTPTLYNVALADRAYWDGRLDGKDLPTTVRDHLAEAHFMAVDGRLLVERLNQVPGYVEMFSAAFDSDPGYGNVLKAITAYVASLNTRASAYDRYLAGDRDALSDDARAGLALFEGRAGCSTCHSGPGLTTGRFADTGVGTGPHLLDDPEREATFRRFFRTLGVPGYRTLEEDVGLFAVTMEPGDRGAFRIPGLREVARTAPYMHDGSLATLEEVVEFYNDGGGRGQSADLEPLRLSAEQVRQIVAFLESLSSDLVEVVPPTLPDYGLLPIGGSSP